MLLFILFFSKIIPTKNIFLKKKIQFFFYILFNLFN